MRKSKLFVICLGILLVGLFATGFYSINNVHTQGTYIISEQNIVEKNGEHFLLIDERELSLSEDFYENIELEKYTEYKINYSYNQLTKNDGEVVMLKRYGEQPWGNK
ncbi:hypothetical protein [Solibacillus sp. CAU 1738]|uniref:hypothetical protein n=1 Tax=Solibacillus sp. CAU 1738 TaxID=3140363 RepID=UPI0032618C01